MVEDGRRPGAVPDDEGPMPVDVAAGADTDGDGMSDTLLADDGAELLVHVDLDGDGFADRLLRIDADATVTTGPEPVVDGNAPAVPSWSALLGRLLD
jgi:hypothetical protein